jgi:hypothetical protein
MCSWVSVVFKLRMRGIERVEEDENQVEREMGRTGRR